MAVHRVECDDENLILAARAIEYGLNNMPHKTAVVTYRDGCSEVDFHVKKTKRGISVIQGYPITATGG